MCAVGGVGGCGVSWGWYGVWGRREKRRWRRDASYRGRSSHQNLLPAHSHSHETTHTQGREEANTLRTKRQGESQCKMQRKTRKRPARAGDRVDLWSTSQPYTTNTTTPHYLTTPPSLPIPTRTINTQKALLLACLERERDHRLLSAQSDTPSSTSSSSSSSSSSPAVLPRSPSSHPSPLPAAISVAARAPVAGAARVGAAAEAAV